MLAAMLRANRSLRKLDLSDNHLCGLDWRGHGAPNLPLLTELGRALAAAPRLRWLAILNNALDTNDECAAVFGAALATRGASAPPLELCYALSEEEKRALLVEQAKYRRAHAAARLGTEPSARSSGGGRSPTNRIMDR